MRDDPFLLGEVDPELHLLGRNVDNQVRWWECGNDLRRQLGVFADRRIELIDMGLAVGVGFPHGLA